jgi:hypothetical protein
MIEQEKLSIRGQQMDKLRYDARAKISNNEKPLVTVLENTPNHLWEGLFEAVAGNPHVKTGKRRRKDGSRGDTISIIVMKDNARRMLVLIADRSRSIVNSFYELFNYIRHVSPPLRVSSDGRLKYFLPLKQPTIHLSLH